MQVLEGPDQGQIIKFCLTENQPFFKVGRKTENNLSVPDDQHLSNLHARFFIIDGKVHIEDMSSTNGYFHY
jgi:pSer/pThr/pTyr-binding forkhead associated (FHA) protein